MLAFKNKSKKSLDKKPREKSIKKTNKKPRKKTNKKPSKKTRKIANKKPSKKNKNPILSLSDLNIKKQINEARNKALSVLGNIKKM